MQHQIALFIDAENVSYRDFPRILESIPRLNGQLVLRAIYGDWDQPNLQKWRELAEQRQFKIRNQSNPSKTKNSTDMKLIMDAMEVLYRANIDIFCFVTNDADYIPLCDKLREAKKYVVGMGYSHNASEALIRACDQFMFIGTGESVIEANQLLPLIEPVVPPPPVSPPNPAAAEADARKRLADQMAVQALLKKAFAQATALDANGWISLSALGTTLREVQADFSAPKYGYATLTNLLESMPDVVELHTNGSGKTARLKGYTPPKPKQPSALKTASTAPAQELKKLITAGFDQATAKDAEGWVTLSTLGSALRQVRPGFTSNAHGHSTLIKLLKTMPDLVELRKKGGADSARIKK